MKRMSFLLGVAFIVLAPAAGAQDHGEIGVYADYFRLGQTKSNYGGLGGRVSLNTSKLFELEAEMNYDFEQAFTEGFANPSTGAITFQQSNLRVLHGLFGPKLQTSHGAVRAFVTVKGGFTNFRFDPRPVTFATFTSSVQDLRSTNVNGALYPGAGLETFLGPIGLRLDLGDEIYFNHGAHHNLRLAFGPHIRF